LLSDAPALSPLGWSEHFRIEFEPHADAGLSPGRVATQHRGVWVLATAEGEVEAQITGRMRFEGELPAVGDWVAYRDGVIHALLPRRTGFVRRAAGNETVEQVVAANVDTAFLVMSFYRDLNPRRLERYLALAWESGADPVIVLTKFDLAEDAEAALAEVESVAIGVPVHAVSAVTGQGLDELEPYLTPGRTVVLLGSSGVGKSTLVNALLGEERQAVKEIREFDGRGRHTTTARELIALPGGGLVLDTPGMRELQLWDAGEGLAGTFGDIDELARECRFSDCSHESEPGCAVRGVVDAERLESWRKLARELRHLELKQDGRARSEARKERRRFSRSMRKSAW
jgi:ribosome biogenesis GTPase / thiamine phosphate phosphatase